MRTVPKKRKKIEPGNRKFVVEKLVITKEDGKVKNSGRILIERNFVIEIFQLIASDMFGMDFVDYDRDTSNGNYIILTTPPGTPTNFKRRKFISRKKIGEVVSSNTITPTDAFRRTRKVKKYIQKGKKIV